MLGLNNLLQNLIFYTISKINLKSEKFDTIVEKNSIKNITSWNTDSEYQQKKISSLLKDVEKFINYIENSFDFKIEYPFNEIYYWLEQNTCEECIEYVVSIMMVISSFFASSIK